MAASKAKLNALGAFTNRGTVNAIVETPRGKRNKFRLDEQLQLFRLGKVLPAGSSFPYDFGFIPGTKAEDGDPLDVLVLMDESAFPGCVVESRLAGVIEAEQVENGESIRNDRLVAVAAEAHNYRDIKSLRDINAELLNELEHFFKSYNEAEGREFRLLGLKGPRRARQLVKDSMKTARTKRKARKPR